MSELEQYFSQFRKEIVGIDACYESPYGKKQMIYADWIASGRLYRPIEDKMLNQFGPMVANTHTESSEAGKFMTDSYHHAQKVIKRHVNAGTNDVIISCGFGMTAVINKFQRILGLKNKGLVFKNPEDRPIVFVTHMEHHSNQTSWYETNAEVIVVEPDENLLVSPEKLREAIKPYKNRPLKIGSFSACSNVTGIITPYHQLAKVMHEEQGLCFIDFAASAPYVAMNMHPADPLEKLDAIFFSPHKFLGGPGSSGIMIFDSSLYHNAVPDQPGGGTVDWTNPWGQYKYIDNIEQREDGGTPGFLETIRVALSIKLKEKMGVDNIHKREKELVDLAFSKLDGIQGVNILAKEAKNRIGAISLYIENVHYNLLTKMLSDRFGVQVRGGCVCAGTYGHFLLHVTKAQSDEITCLINTGDLSKKPGWIRWSIHPTTTDKEVEFIADAIKQIALNHVEWSKEYHYHCNTNEFHHNSTTTLHNPEVDRIFEF
ncbi:MAG: aminotransferase class V-fold PLP-dependent enzyme [Bacteroidales bacterium]|nr:MAG: aminotransferase class V-fold PLP-dependent enzyme [Bacteroidales bacterium]